MNHTLVCQCQHCLHQNEVDVPMDGSLGTDVRAFNCQVCFQENMITLTYSVKVEVDRSRTSVMAQRNEYSR